MINQLNNNTLSPKSQAFFAYNGMLKDDEIQGVGNSYTTEFRQFDPRLGKWWSLDPVVLESESSYASNRNNPISYSDPEGDCPDCPKDGEKGDIHTSKDSKPFNAPNGQLLSGTDGKGISVWSSNKLSGITYVNTGNNEWKAIGFETKSGERFTWNNQKNWYVNKNGEEFDDHASFDIANMVGGSMKMPIQMFTDKVQNDDAFKAFRQAFYAHGGSLSSFMWDGFKQTISDISAGGHTGTQALGAMYTGFLMNGGAITSQSTLLLYNGTMRSTLKSSLNMRTLGKASSGLNYYTLIAKNLSITGKTSRTAAGIFVQINHNLNNIMNGNPIKILYSSTLTTITGRSWQNSSIGMGLGLGGYGTITNFGGMSFYQYNGLTLGK